MPDEANKEREDIMNALEAMEKLESIIELWQKGDLDSEEALEQITILTDSL